MPILRRIALVASAFIMLGSTLAVAQVEGEWATQVEQRLKRLEGFHGILRAHSSDLSGPSARPVQLQTVDGTFFTLYRRVGTEIEIRLSDGSNIEGLVFSSNTGSVLPHGFNPDRVTVVPERRRFVLNANFTDNPMDITPLLFDVVEPPLPRLRLLVDGQQHDGISQIDHNRKVTLQIVPDDGFARQYPRDARYKLGRVELLQPHADGTVTTLKRFDNATTGAELAIDLSSAPNGKSLLLRVNNISRINFSNRNTPVLLDDQDLIMPITTR